MKEPLRWLILVVWAAFALTGSGRAAGAAPAAESWSLPVMISHPDTPATQPEIAADDYGRVHVIFQERLQPDTQCAYDSLVYTGLIDGKWTAPRDVLISPQNRCIFEHAIAAGSQDYRLHAVFSDYELYYSAAPLDQAQFPLAWSKPVVVDATGARHPALVVDNAHSRIHVAYYKSQPEWKVCYARSDDGGDSWTDPNCIHDAPSGYRIENVEMAVDGSGRVHLAWTDEITSKPMSRGGSVYYARSIDGGDTFSDPIVVDEQNQKYQADYGAGEIAVATVGEGEVHLAWAGAPAGQRWHQWSSDGGATWSPAREIAPQDRLFRWFNAGLSLQPDSAGRVHLISSSEPIKHVVWDRDHWSEVDVVNEASPYWPRLAVVQGNILVVVSAFTPDGGQVPYDKMSIYAITAQTGAPALPAQPLPPTPVSEISPTPAARLSSTAQSSQHTAVIPLPPAPAGPLESSATADLTAVQVLLVSLGPVLLAIVVLVIFRGGRGSSGRRSF